MKSVINPSCMHCCPLNRMPCGDCCLLKTQDELQRLLKSTHCLNKPLCNTGPCLLVCPVPCQDRLKTKCSSCPLTEPHPSCKYWLVVTSNLYRFHTSNFAEKLHQCSPVCVFLGFKGTTETYLDHTSTISNARYYHPCLIQCHNSLMKLKQEKQLKQFQRCVWMSLQNQSKYMMVWWLLQLHPSNCYVMLADGLQFHKQVQSKECSAGSNAPETALKRSMVESAQEQFGQCLRFTQFQFLLNQMQKTGLST